MIEVNDTSRWSVEYQCQFIKGDTGTARFCLLQVTLWRGDKQTDHAPILAHILRSVHPEQPPFTQPSGI